ncbi:MAG: hypothetical protein ACI9MC_001693 [Kiritimatiellia bacterium]|jgi:uncharacterized protein YjgD (DUF1641 family)
MSEESDDAGVSDGQVLDEILDTLDLLLQRMGRLEGQVEGMKGGADAFLADQLNAIEGKLDGMSDSAPKAAGSLASPRTQGGQEIIESIDRKVDAIVSATVRRKDDSVPAPPMDPALAARLANADVGAALVRVLDRLESIEGTLQTLDTVAQKAPVLIQGAAHTADWVMAQAEERGIDMFELGFRGLEMAEKAAKPANIDALSELVDALPTASFAADAGGKVLTALQNSDVDMDAVVNSTADLAVKATKMIGTPGFDKLVNAALDADKLEKSADALVRLMEVVQTPEFQKLLDSGLLDSSVLGTVGTATTALVETRKSGWDPVGIFGMLGVLGDKDVQRAVGFGAAVARRLGAALK